MIRIAAALLLGAAVCCANVVLQFEYDDEMGITHKNWLEVEACWVGDPDADEDDPIPVPQPLEKFTENNHTFEHPFVVKTSGRPIKVYYLNYADEIVRELGSEEYTISYTEPEFDINQGYNFDSASPRLEDNLNCSINITGTLPEKYDKWAVEYHFINLPRLPKYPAPTYENNIHYSYCPTSPVIKNFMKEQIKNVVEEPELRPRYIHFGHDEPWQMNTCERCRNVITAPGVTAPGQLFADSVNYLVDEYEDVCDTYNVDDPRVIIWADHVSYPHEIVKVTDWKGQGYYDWWHYRGATSSKRVSTCKSVIDKSVIANDWNYSYEWDKPAEGYLKYQYIEDLTEAGFDVLGANAGYADKKSGSGVGSHKGTTVSTEAWYLLTPEDPESLPAQYNHLGYEGSYASNLPLTKEGNKDENDRYWFTRPNNTFYNHTLDTPNDAPVDEIRVRCDLRGKSVTGTAWFDDVELAYENTVPIEPVWVALMDEDINNGDFEDVDSGPGAVFDDWVDPAFARTNCFADDEVHRDDFGDEPENDTTSCRFEITENTDNAYEDPIYIPITGLNIPDGYRIRMRGYIQTEEVDTLRLGCPWQWEKEGLGFRNPSSRPSGKYLGQSQWGNVGMPMEDGTNVWFKKGAGNVAIAEWCWSFGYPSTPYLKSIQWDPFITFEKEVTW